MELFKNGVKWLENKGFLKIPLFSFVGFLMIIPILNINNVYAQNNLSATCYVDPLSVYVGESVLWRVQASGGAGNYEYFWSGDENLSGTGPAITKVYQSSGDKEATVTVYSGGQIVTPTCELQVENYPDPLSAACFPENSVVPISQKVTFKTQASGGEGRYNFSWSGDENLSGSGRSKSKLYSSLGIKQAIIVVSSGNQSLVRNCTVEIVPDPVLEGSCYPDNFSVASGKSVTWKAEVSGGTGKYKFVWTGSDELSGKKQGVSQIYNSSGMKEAFVTITSGSQEIVRSCSVNVGAVLGDFTGKPSGSLSAACFANPQVSEVGKEVQWSVMVSGGSGPYYYEWLGTDNLTGFSPTVSKIYNTSGTKTAYITIDSGHESTEAACSIQVFDKGNLPANVGISIDDFPQTRILSTGWLVFYIFSFFIATVLFLIIFFAIRKKNQELKGKEKDLAFAFDGDSTDKSLSKIIESESKKREVLISTDALKELMDRSGNDILESVKHLDLISKKIKEPGASVSSEERWPVIGKGDVEEHFLSVSGFELPR